MDFDVMSNNGQHKKYLIFNYKNLLPEGKEPDGFAQIHKIVEHINLSI